MSELNSGNRLIAEFMGVEKDGEKYLMGNVPHIYATCWLTEEYLQYHTSWDWFIPAYSKWRVLFDKQKEITFPPVDWDEDIIQAIFDNNPLYAQECLAEGIEWLNKEQSAQGSVASKAK